MKNPMQRVLPFGVMLFVSLAASGAAAAQSSYDLRSPDKRIEIRVRAVPHLRYDIILKGRAVMEDCTLSLEIDHVTLGINPKVVSSKERSYDQVIEPPVRQKFAKIRENYNELRLEIEGGYAVVFRAYNEGAAYRFETSLPKQQVKVYGEGVKFNFASDTIAYYPALGCGRSFQVRSFGPSRL